MTLIRKIGLVFFYLCIKHACEAQVMPEIQKGDRAFDRFDYNEALYFYNVANESNPSDPSITRKIANTYRRMGQFNNSSEWYEATLTLDSTNAEDMLYYAEALKNLGQYDEAVRWYETYNRIKPGDIRAESHLSDKLYYLDYFADTAKYKMKKLKINNDQPVIGVSFFEGENLLISAINSDNKKTNNDAEFLDVYSCSINEKFELEDPIKLDKKVNSKFHDGPAFYSSSDNNLYITRSNIRKGKPVRDKKGNVNLKLYTSNYANGEWHTAQELQFNSDEYSTAHASISKDGNTLYFVSTKEGGYGGTDIYQCFRTPGGWSDPVNVGENINTPGNEMFPFIAEDGKLYFASDGHAGLGGLDVFHSSRKAEIWQKPINMGAPINSTMDDFSIVYDEKNDYGFFCSNRSSMGDDDLYFYRIVKIDKMILSGTIHAKTKDILLADQKIKVVRKNNAVTETVSLNGNERFEISLVAGEKIAVYMDNGDYFNTSQPIFTYNAPAILEDPYINIGTKEVSLTHAPDTTGNLAEIASRNFEKLAMRNAELQEEEARLTRRAMTELKGISTGVSIPMLDQSSLITLTIEQRRLAYTRHMNQADSLNQSGQYDAAKTEYFRASAMMPSDPEPTMRVIELDNKLQTSQKTDTDLAYDKLIARADSLFDLSLWTESLKYYIQAKSIASDKVYPRMQINRIYRLMGKDDKPEPDSQSTNQTSKPGNPVDLAQQEIDYIIFNYNSFALRPEDLKKVDALSKIMKENPQCILMVRTHCDSRGSLEYNQKLSMQRAKAIHNYLIKKGIDKNRLMAEWYGELRPLRRCNEGIDCDEGDHQMNRRAEFKLIRL